MPAEYTVDRTSPVPLYFQLSQQMEAAIRSGHLKPGEMIETEMQLAARHGLSRPTVRHAIQDLVNKGLLFRRRGVGTHVVNSPLRRSVELTSLYEDLVRAGREPTTQVLVLKRILVEGEVPEALNLGSKAHVTYVERLRMVDGEPLSLMRNWLPEGQFQPKRSALEENGLYELLRSQGIHVTMANQQIRATAATAEESRILHVKKGSPLLNMRRIALNEEGQPVELSNHVYRSDTYMFETTLMAR